MSMITTEQCVEWLDKNIEYSSRFLDGTTATEHMEVIRAKLLAAEEMAKALDQIRHDFITLLHLNLGGDLSQREMKNKGNKLRDEMDKALTAYSAAGGK